MTLMYFFAYMTIGLSLGWLSRVIAGDQGIGMYPSLIFGVLGSIAGLMIVKITGLAGTAFFALIGAIAVLFTVNVFRQDDPVFKSITLS